MYALIANIIALLSDLLGRITPARAEKIDNADVPMSSRAPANTAVSNAVLTDARIANLDNLAAAPLRIKRILSGSIQISPNAYNAFIALGIAVNPSKTIVIKLGGYLSVTGQDQTVSTAVELNSAGTQVIVWRSGAPSHWVMVHYQLVEFY